MILITGISGFVGQNLHAYLQRSGRSSIIGLSRDHAPVDRGMVYSYSDFFGEGSVSAQHYIHLAGKAHDLRKIANDQEYFDVNYGLTKRLYDRFLEDPDARTFIFVSSVKAAKDRVEGVLTEDVVCTPGTAYGKSKRKAEEYILGSLPVEKQVYILRPCMIHGPGNKGNLNLLYSFAQKGLPYPLAAFENQRSFLSVDNLTHVIGRLIGTPIPSGVYNVADDGTFSTNEIMGMMANALGKKPMLWKVPVPLMTGLARMGDRLGLPLNAERLQKLTESYVVSNERIKAALGEEFMPLSAKDGLMKTFQSFGDR